MSKINNLIAKKKEIEQQIKKEKMEEKQIKKNNSNSHANVLVRISKMANDRLEIILKSLEEKGSKISKPRLTDLIISHKNWGVIEDDCINFNFEEE